MVDLNLPEGAVPDRGGLAFAFQATAQDGTVLLPQAN